MTASFPTSVKSFTTKVDNVDDAMAVDVNGIQDEVVAIETYVIANTAYIDNWKNVFVFDDFLNMQASGLTVFGVGSLTWPFGADTLITTGPTAAALHPSHPGLVNIATTSGTLGFITLGNANVDPNKFDIIQFVGLAESPVEAGDGILYGTCKEGVFATDRTMEGVYFSFIYGETNWKAVTRGASSSTVTDTGVVFNNANWVMFEIKRTATNTFEFYINQSLVATHTTNITAAPLSPYIGMSSQTIGSYGVYIDYFGMQLAPITQRWD
jgi:hypothetical protein